MKRRNLVHLAGALAALPLLGRPALAAVDAVEGRNFSVMSQPQPVSVAGKVEVIEFFGYWCPHCRAFEPKLDAWVKKLPADVVFKRVPVAWRPGQESAQRLFFALEALGAPSGIHEKVFAAVQLQGLALDQPAAINAFAAANGLDGAKLSEAMSGFAVSSKARMATQVSKAYGVDGVPSLVIQGRFVTSPGTAGGEDAALQVADALIRKAKGAR
ncbi:Thiol:disulfide interchange protein [Rubrivivax sp. A210]|uniref:thiol:disulfide interchange protein DsbA/DsbL n=1 Tax=Rubrivivax sp. A210 TaxID=2772301 RepID=UPI001918B22C|nr:thiol:disulfide interchange protein DsbA/DsbL [Rubrivivax sp. A210]CAD5371871.1 Thiol:disulfide interchange protein [Rubrivivax sp. A210]